MLSGDRSMIELKVRHQKDIKIALKQSKQKQKDRQIIMIKNKLHRKDNSNKSERRNGWKKKVMYLIDWKHSTLHSLRQTAGTQEACPTGVEH